MQQVVRPNVPAAPATGAQPILLGLIGSPIKSSAAPAIHEASAQALGLSAHYRLIDVAGADRETLRAMLNGVRLLGFSGVNVTFPYKEAVLPLLDALSPGAAAIGTVNTVVVQDGKLTGHNTDATGFAAAFGEIFGSPGERVVALVGAGGVGRAIAFALAEIGARELRLFDADRAKADALAERLIAFSSEVDTGSRQENASMQEPVGRIAVRVCDSVAQALDSAGILVNATPIGMLPNTECPVAPELIHRDLWVADAVYTPLWTPLLRVARERGARTMTGREFNIAQAVDASRLFTGREPSREVIAATFDAVIARRNEPRDIYMPTTNKTGRM
jgi:quinate/shikimate dehydrogenase (NAD+)